MKELILNFTTSPFPSTDKIMNHISCTFPMPVRREKELGQVVIPREIGPRRTQLTTDNRVTPSIIICGKGVKLVVRTRT